jgi:hypothetical protein
VLLLLSIVNVVGQLKLRIAGKDKFEFSHFFDLIMLTFVSTLSTNQW